MASSGVPTWRGTEGLRVTEDRPSRKDFVQGASAGGVFLRAVAAAAILSGVQGARKGARRRQR